MNTIVWCWKKGKKTIYTRQIEVVDKAMKEGHDVFPYIIRSHIHKGDIKNKF